MKAIRVTEFGGPEVLQVTEIPDPVPGPGEVLVRVHAAGVNPVETYIRSGKYAALPPLPYTPGNDAAGRIEALGPDVTGVNPGDRVYVAGSITGTYAELCLCPAMSVHPLPAAIGFSQGAALGVPYSTAHYALFHRGQARSGETVLVHGGTGGVGLAAIQFARAAGLTVFATGGTEAGRALLQQQGVHAVFDHSTPDYLAAINDRTGGRGVDLIIEMLANVNLRNDLLLLAAHGRVIVVGSRGPIEINPRDAMVRDADIRGVMLAQAAPEVVQEVHRAIVGGLTDGSLQPVVGRQFALPEAPQAHEAVMAPGAGGKIVLVL